MNRTLQDASFHSFWWEGAFMKQGKHYTTVILWIFLAAIAAYFGYNVISSLAEPLIIGMPCFWQTSATAAVRVES